MRDPNEEGKKYRVIGLNRAIYVLSHVEVLAFCHRTTWEDIRRYQRRADKLLTGEPMCWDPGIDTVFRHEELTKLFHEGRLEVRNRVNRDDVAPWDLWQHYPHNHTVACFAAAWLCANNVRKFYSYGVCDDPKARHPVFRRRKSSRPRWHKPYYFEAYRSFLRTIEALGMGWEPLGENPPIRELKDLDRMYCAP